MGQRTVCLSVLRGCSAVGSAPPWHGGGQGFESPQLHVKQPVLPGDEELFEKRLMVSDHSAKTHPISGFIAAVIWGLLSFMIVVGLNDTGKALVALPFLLGWPIVALVLFRDKKPGSEH